MTRALAPALAPALALALALILPLAAHAQDSAATRGKALAEAGDCVACHTAPGGAPFAGGRALPTPFGTITTANITPDPETGIGTWTEADFARAMSHGLRPDGGHLYPAFPYPYYARLTPQDTAALFAWLRTIKPVHNAVDRDTLPLPYRLRFLMAGWNLLFHSATPFTPDPARSAEFNRGAYLVQGLGHCGACHTPLNSLGANRDSEQFQGGTLEGWTVPNITTDPRLGIGAWSVDDIVTYLKTGANGSNLASGPMAEVVMRSTALMPEADLRAIAVYLKERATPAPTPAPAKAATNEAGQAIYTDTCGACHGRDGAGVPGIFPRLNANPVVLQPDPASLVRVVLSGAKAAATATAPTGPAMPSFGFRLCDSQVASVVTYIRNAWSNAAAPVSPETVATARASQPKPEPP